jgi:hypothetical protein
MISMLITSVSSTLHLESGSVCTYGIRLILQPGLDLWLLQDGSPVLAFVDIFERVHIFAFQMSIQVGEFYDQLCVA